MRLFFTAGTQFTFARLDAVVRQVALCQPSWQLAYQAGPGADVEKMFEFENLNVKALMSAEEFSRHLREADLVVTHAGMGNVISCLEQGKPFVLLPRKANYAEHRNNHQVDSAEAVSRLYSIPVFYEAEKLATSLCKGVMPVEAANVATELSLQRGAFGIQLQQLIDSI